MTIVNFAVIADAFIKTVSTSEQPFPPNPMITPLQQLEAGYRRNIKHHFRKLFSLKHTLDGQDSIVLDINSVMDLVTLGMVLKDNWEQLPPQVKSALAIMSKLQPEDY